MSGLLCASPIAIPKGNTEVTGSQATLHHATWMVLVGRCQLEVLQQTNAQTLRMNTP